MAQTTEGTERGSKSTQDLIDECKKLVSAYSPMGPDVGTVKHSRDVYAHSRIDAMEKERKELLKLLHHQVEVIRYQAGQIEKLEGRMDEAARRIGEMERCQN